MVFVKGVLERKKFQIFLAKTVVSVKGVLEDEKVSDSFVQNGTSCPLGSEGKKLPKKRTTSPVFVKGVLEKKSSESFGQTEIFVQWVLKEENMKIFRSKRPELSRGYWGEKVSDLFGQTAHFPPVGSGRKSSRKSGPPYRF